MGGRKRRRHERRWTPRRVRDFSRYYSGGTDPGGVYVWLGGPAFHTVPDLTIRGAGASDRPTYAANAGDVNADGFSDLIVSKSGHAEVYLGGSSLHAIPDLTITGNFGTVAGAGDVNGDGVDDFAVGDAGDDTGGADAGRVSVYFEATRSTGSRI